MRRGHIGQGRNGIAGRHWRQHNTWTRPVVDTQTAGAGDTFAAALTMASSCLMPLTTDLGLAQTAADVVEHGTGTAVCTTADLALMLGDITGRVFDAEQLGQKLSQAGARENGWC